MNEPRIYQLKITLRYTRPPIWRRVLVPGDMSLGELHDVIQIVMGWGDEHLHAFKAHGVQYVPPGPESKPLWGPPPRNEDNAALQAVAPGEKSRFVYEYDFGDSWRHDIVVEKILPPEEGKRYPVCVAGKLAGPPEDSGGVYGYAMKLEVLSDPADPDYEEIAEWMGGDFDPERFDLEAVNARLAGLQKRQQRRIAEDAGSETDLADALTSLKVPRARRERARQIMEISDRFAAERLDMDYAHAARRVLATLARKRPSPLAEGEPRLWAAAALNVVMAANLPFDEARDPGSDTARLSELSGLPAKEVLNQGERVLAALQLHPFDAVLPRYAPLVGSLMLWLENVAAGVADPGSPPPALQKAAERIMRLAEQAEAAREEASRQGPTQEKPQLRLIDSSSPQRDEPNKEQ